MNINAYYVKKIFLDSVVVDTDLGFDRVYNLYHNDNIDSENLYKVLKK